MTPDWQLGTEALVGAGTIIVGGVVWYQVYGRSRAIKESAFRESVRQQGMSRLLGLIDEALNEDSRRVAVVTPRERSATPLLRIGRPMAGSDRESELVQLLQTGEGLEEKILEYAPDLVIGAQVAIDGRHDELPADRDAVLFMGSELGEIRRIAVLGSGGPYDVLKICLAAKLAQAEDASIRFVHVLDPAVSRAQVRSIERFHADVGELCGVPTESMVIESEDLLVALTSAVGDADLAIIGAPRGRHFFTDLIDRIVGGIAPPVLLVRVAAKDQPATLRSFLDRVVASRLTRSDATHDS